jgi:hypothetical protein
LKSAVCTIRPTGVSMTSIDDCGIECDTGSGRHRERPETSAACRCREARAGAARVEVVLRETARTSPACRATVDRNVAAREQEGERADVVFVAVREEDRVNRAAVVEEFHVGDDDVDAQVLGAGNIIPASTTRQSPP